jgi:hypothetical protein
MQLQLMTNLDENEDEKCIYIIHFLCLGKNKEESSCFYDSWCGSWATRHYMAFYSTWIMTIDPNCKNICN